VRRLLTLGTHRGSAQAGQPSPCSSTA
jgi:hypothetical protein